MEFAAKEDVEAPLDQVFAEMSDFDMIERSVMRHGVEVQRKDPGCAPKEGSAWTAQFRFRGKTRDAAVTLTRYEPPQAMAFQTVSGGLEAQTRIDLVALSRSRTRISLVVDLQPKTLSARLLVQSMKLARSNLSKKFQLRAADYAKELEDRLKRRV
ncbi:SRPBCC family protein [Puniceibacterium confluentis]|uniref:SRPBCC family protein n=1 Tax=Puniceibacterium confluentis TaxID=1958944 RepID=UPI0011B493FA|nr:SRPBCC family protein [Puniceibacterium confluentis]